MRLEVFFHAACMNHWREIVTELAGMIDGSGLYDVASELTLSMVGPPGKIPGLVGDRWKHVVHPVGIDAYEYPTLELLWKTCQRYPETYALYIHTKGASHVGARPQRDAWRRYMAHFVIGHWRQAVQHLAEGYEAVGCEFRPNDRHFLPHFAGNFWWARGDYVAELPRPEPNNTRHHPRFPAEMWVLGNTPEIITMHQSVPGFGFRHSWSGFRIIEKSYRQPVMLLAEGITKNLDG